MSLVNNEQAKLLASFFNGIAIAAAVAGVVAPVAALSYGVSTAPNLSAGRVVVLSLIWLLVSVALHYISRRTLKRLT
jgi:hypothetical protein